MAPNRWDDVPQRLDYQLEVYTVGTWSWAGHNGRFLGYQRRGIIARRIDRGTRHSKRETSDLRRHLRGENTL